MTDEMDDGERKEIRSAFAEAVNMSPSELEKFLETDESKSVGRVGDKNKSSSSGPESTGHESGREIVRIKRKKVADLTEDDYAHMKKVTGYVHRHLKQEPKGDTKDSRWRHSLMNWGHDPEKD